MDYADDVGCVVLLSSWIHDVVPYAVTKGGKNVWEKCVIMRAGAVVVRTCTETPNGLIDRL